MSFVRKQPRGFAVVAVLVCLLVVSLVGAALVKQIVLRHRQARLQQRQLQAFWLAESGLERAAAQLAASSGYEGETWRPAAESLGGDDRGLVIVRVEPVGDEKARRKVRVEARFPDDPIHGVLQTKEAFVNTTGLGGQS